MSKKINKKKEKKEVLNKIEQSNLDKKKKITFNFQKLKQFLKTTKGKIIVGATTSTVLLTGGITTAVIHYENTKQVGTEIVQTKQEIKEGKRSDQQTNRAKDVLAKQIDNSRSKDRGYKYLFESPLYYFNKENNERNKNKEEFNGATNLILNQITLLSTKDPSDVNAASALWIRNKENYKFTTDENIIASGIGRDTLIYNQYLETLDGVDSRAIYELEYNFGQEFKNKISTPYSGATIATNLNIAGLAGLAQDGNSTPIKYSVQYVGSTQFKNYEDVIQKTSRINIHTTNSNKSLDAWNQTDSINSVYEVYFKEVSTDRDIVAVLTENQEGEIKLYGLYYKTIYLEDPMIRDYNHQATRNEISTKDLTWDTFVQYTN